MDQMEYDRRHWHISKSISVGHILTTLTAMLAAFWFLAQQDTRISNLELNYSHLKASRAEDQARTDRKFEELKTDLRTINAKLDRLIESQSGGY
ncbi:hypothetical protein [Marinobacter salsuginis]|uniref:hypothetical protein n=2 Tax=Marinobacter TaxID=2742 RepID=UPI000C09304E|nr:hypothetical protein [Marinobacter salsuginis]MAM85722.1 hypothetical protein [Hahellaceae bacterium]QTN41711.1 hypothetical protein HZ997_19135 [Marinobacter salsuginis]